VTDVFCPSILSYHCSDALVAMDRLPVAIVTYGLLVQSPVVVVKICCNLLDSRGGIFIKSLDNGLVSVVLAGDKYI
jgi:hypothetical protein